MNSQTAIVRLLQRLFKKTARQSKAFDSYQNEFLNKLHISASEDAARALFNECIEQLSQDEFPLDKTLAEGRLIVSQSQLQLQKLNHLSPAAQAKIAATKSTTPPYSIIEFHNELTSIIKVYQRIVIELNKVPTENEEAPAQYDEASIELQQLIIDLDIGEPYINKLDEISVKIAAVNDPLKLLNYCISIIAIIIDSTRDERYSSRHFLYTLNESLTQFYSNFAKNIKLAEHSFDEQEQCIKQIQKNSRQLKDNAEQASDMASLREHIFIYVENIEQLISMKETKRSYKVQLQLQSMVREIKELQNETKDYQKTLTKQKKKLQLDFLTKVPNRAAWSDRLSIEYNRCKRYKNPLNIAIIDIDHFKKINDTFGHLAGDKVLNVVAQTLQKSLRSVDFIARYGGEEFAVLLPEITPEQMQIALEKLRNKVQKIPFKFKKNILTITISIGCTDFVAEDSIDTVFERADRALYYAKNNGRNQVSYFTPK